MKEKHYKAWHFAKADQNGKPILGFSDGRKIEIGETLSVECKPILCKQGLHGSIKILDALGYANDDIICLVEIWGNVVVESDKIVGRHRKCLNYMRLADSQKLLRCFARMIALSVADKWNCPDICFDWLMTGDENIRIRARSAANSAAYAAANASDAACAAADAAYEAANAAYWAANSATRSAANKLLTDLVLSEMNNSKGK